MNGDVNENNDAGNRKNNNQTITSKYFKYKTKIIVNTSDNNSRLEAEIFVPLKYLCKISRSLDLLLINCDIELDWPWSKYCVIFEISEVPANPRVNPPVPAKKTKL